ncbi:hypothetical protein D3C78_1495030 [compost metagenome]
MVETVSSHFAVRNMFQKVALLVEMAVRVLMSYLESMRACGRLWISAINVISRDSVA